jgi:hypothetical protein
MTRNNLGPQISWLLQNLELSKPTSINFPAPRDPLALSFSLSQIDSRSFGSQADAASSGSVVSQSFSISRTRHLSEANALSSFRDDFEDEEEAFAEVESMARLTSAGKSQRPSLLIKQRQSQQQLPTPAPTSRPRTLHQAYEDSLRSQRTSNPVGRGAHVFS